MNDQTSNVDHRYTTYLHRSKDLQGAMEQPKDGHPSCTRHQVRHSNQCPFLRPGSPLLSVSARMHLSRARPLPRTTMREKAKAVCRRRSAPAGWVEGCSCLPCVPVYFPQVALPGESHHTKTYRQMKAEKAQDYTDSYCTVLRELRVASQYCKVPELDERVHYCTLRTD